MKSKYFVPAILGLTTTVMFISAGVAKEGLSINGTFDSLDGKYVSRAQGAIEALTDKHITLTSRGGREKFTINQNTFFCIGSKKRESLSGLKVGDAAVVTTNLENDHDALSIRDGGLVFSLSQSGASSSNIETCDRWIVSLWRKKKSEKVDMTCEAQELLTKLGYEAGGVDGILGQNTISAINQFLVDNGIKEKAQVNEYTIKMLHANYNKKKKSKENLQSKNKRLDNGYVLNQTKANNIAPLEIITPDKGYDFVVKLVRKKNEANVKSFYVLGGSTYKTKIPLGKMELKYAAGSNWYSNNCLFGMDTQYSKAEKTFDFSQKGESVSGYTVELILQSGGNLRASKISPKQW